MSLLQKANKTKELWAISLKRSSYQDIVTCYNKDFIFKGTYNKKITKDNAELNKYFKSFTQKVNDVTFFKNNMNIIKNNMIFDVGRYNFKSDNGIIKAQYFMVFDDKGKILIHYSTFY